MILFSILMPAYKASFLKEAIESVLAQTYQNLELIIVDDCSPENLHSIVETFSDDRIHYERNAKNIGAVNLVDNWNHCLECAKGDYVICMGDDDKLAPTCLEDYVNLINKYPGLNVYHSRTVLIDENSEAWQIQEQRPEFESGYSLWWHRWNGRGRQYIGDFLYQKEHLLSVGGFYKLPLAWASDDITAVRASIETGIANTERPGFFYRENRLTISNSASERIKAEATCQEKQWYIDLLNRSTPEDETDALLVRLLKRDLNAHFQYRFILCCQNDISRNPFRFIYWYRRRKEFLLSKRMVFGMFMRASMRILMSH